MPRTRSLAWSELKIGVLTSVAIAIAAVAIFTLTGTKGFFWQRYNLKTRFPNAIGLTVGSPVRIAGVEVGSVKGVDVVGEEVDITLEVNKDHRSQITTASWRYVGTSSSSSRPSTSSPGVSSSRAAHWSSVIDERLRDRTATLRTMAPAYPGSWRL